jgi:hypothetical protein
MNKLLSTLLSVSLIAGFAGKAQADDDGCSTAMMAGRWVFATGIGHQTLPQAPAPGDITAIGTMNINRTGELEGAFNVTFEGAAFFPGVPYSGTITINADCTGTVSFVTGVGTARSDSIVVLNRYEFWGMSEDPSNLWTYQARRLPGRLNHWTY